MKRTLSYRLLTVSAFALAAASAGAQDDNDDQIFVTALGPDRGADELISGAVAVDRDAILADLASTLGDTLDSQPGVASTFFGQGASRPVLRGLGAERVLVLTNGIGVIDASAASADHQVTADGIDAERIEILRGPAALAYGGQAIGGVVNVIDGLIAETAADKPLSFEGYTAYNDVNEGTEAAGRAEIAAGPFVLTLSGSLRDFGDYDIPGFAESDTLRALEEAEHDEEEGEEHEEEEEARDTLPNSFLDTQTLAAGLSWVGDEAFFGVAVRQQTAEYGLPGHSHEHEEGEEGEGEEGEEEEENPFIDLEQVRIDLRAGIDLDAGPITGVIGTVAIADYEHTEFEAPGEAGTLYENEGVEARVEVNHEVAGFSGAVGVQVVDVEFAAVGEEAFVTPTDTTSMAVFLYETKEFANDIGVEGGLRFETVERDNVVFGEADFDLISASAGVHRHFDTGLFLGVQGSVTQRAPSETELFSDGAHLATSQFEIGDPNLDVETGLTLEGAARWSLDGVSFGANLFVTQFSDFVFLSPTGEIDDESELPIVLYLQDDATFVGGEIYGEWLVAAGPLGADWTFDGSLDYVSAELDDGGDVPLIPPLTINAGTRAQWGALGLGADLTFAAEQDNPGVGRLATDSYTLLGLRGDLDVSAFGFEADRAVVFIEARNVTDEEARLATSVLRDVAPLPGRNIRAGLRVRF